MKFDIKDVKSWANRHDVHTLSDVGFFGNSLSEIDDEIKRYNNGEKDCLHEMYQVSDNGCYCFGYAVYFADTGAFGGTNNFAFFLPLDAVKEEKPKEKKYRPLKSIDEMDCLFDCSVMSAKNFLTYRNKVSGKIYIELLFAVCRDKNDVLRSINNIPVQDLFDNFEIRKNGEWLPFGIEVKDE